MDGRPRLPSTRMTLNRHKQGISLRCTVAHVVRQCARLGASSEANLCDDATSLPSLALAAAWPLAARGQQGDRMRRVGVLMGMTKVLLLRAGNEREIDTSVCNYRSTASPCTCRRR
jgi:hypothetical protein